MPLASQLRSQSTFECISLTPFEVSVERRVAPGAIHRLRRMPWPAHRRTGNQRLRQLVRQRGPVADRTVEITFQAVGAQVWLRRFGLEKRSPLEPLEPPTAPANSYT